MGNLQKLVFFHTQKEFAKIGFFLYPKGTFSHLKFFIFIPLNFYFHTSKT